MIRDESLPLIRTKHSLLSRKKYYEIPNDSLYTNESSINFAHLKKTMQMSKMIKSNSTQELFTSQKSSFPNSQSTSFLFNGKYGIEKNNDYDNKNNFFLEDAIYKKDYINKFRKIKTNLYRSKFYNNNEIKIEVDKNENINENQNNEDQNKNINDDIEEDKEKNNIDFTKNIWGSDINLKNHENYDIGGDNGNEEDIMTESDYNDLESIKDLNGINSKRISLYLTDLQNSNNANESPLSLNIQNNTNRNNNHKNKFAFKKINITGKRDKEKNPFNFTRYSSYDNIARFHKLYRNFKNLCRKHFINEKSPSFAFIKSCDKEKIVCNPLGLLKRKGDEHILEMNNQHSGDRYINCLSSGLKYVNHLNNLEMSSNRLTHNGIEKLFSSIKENDAMIKNLVKLNLSNNNIGDEGIEKLTNYIEDKGCQLESLNIEGNNLGDKNINSLCICISQYIWSRLTYFNAGKNKITKNSEKGLLALTEKCTELVVLILRNNQINNYLGTKLMNNLKNLYSLKVLDISWNLIGNHLIYPFLFEEAVNFFPNQKNLYNNFELDKIKTSMKMNFNRNPLLPTIDKNSQGKQNKSKDKSRNEEIIIPEIKSIKVPKRKPSNFAIEFSNYIKSNLCPLIHLNISHNNLPYEDCKLISEESKSNRSILGFHVDGNEMQIDPLGFVHPIGQKEKSFNYYSKSQISFDFESLKGLPKVLMSPINKIRGRNNCWICECWKEIEFILDLKIKDLKPKYSVVKIHLDFENYIPCDMIYKKKCFRLIRMCPPGKIKYFFTVDGNPVKNCYKEYDYKIKEFEKPLKYVFDEKYIEQYNSIKSMLLNPMNKKETKNNTSYENYVNIQEDVRDDDDKLISKTIYIKNYGIRNIIPNNNIITHDYQSTLKYSIPRAENSSTRVQNQVPWQFTDSIWSNCNYFFEGETDEIISKICDFDFNRDEFEGIFMKDNELIEAKNLLKEHYRNIIDCYISLSSYSGGHLWQITSDILIQWLNEKCNFFDDKYTSKHMIKVLENIYFNKKDKEDRAKYKNFPSNKYNLIRHSFISLIINMSIDKYINILRVVTNPFDSLKLSMENHFIKATNGYNHHLWRKERYYNEEIDNYLKAFLPLIDGLYHTFSIKEKEKREKEEKEENEENERTTLQQNNENDDIIRMTLEDFNNFILTFIDPVEYQMSENPLIFHISKKLQIDEITNDDFLYLNLIEFCEGLCRVIDIYSPAPPEEKIEDWPIEKRKDQLLIEKVENIMPQLFKKIEHPKFNTIRDKFISPLKDQITSLYIIDYKNNSFYSGYEKYINKSN